MAVTSWLTASCTAFSINSQAARPQLAESWPTLTLAQSRLCIFRMSILPNFPDVSETLSTACMFSGLLINSMAARKVVLSPMTNGRHML